MRRMPGTPPAALVLSLCLVVSFFASCNSREDEPTLILNPLGLQGQTIQAIALDPLDSSVLYAGTNNGVLKSQDGGRSWNAINNGLGSVNIYVNAIVVDPSNTATLYAGTGSGVFRSRNAGGTWSAVNTGLGTAILSVAIDPSNSATLYASTWGAVYKTCNGGASWFAANSGLKGSIVVIAVNPVTHVVYACGYEGVFRSVDEGANWITLSAGFGGRGVFSLAVDPFDTAILYLGVDGVGAPENRGLAFKSTDSGSTWADMGIPWGYQVSSIAVDPRDNRKICAGTRPAGPAMSADGGVTWVMCRELNSSNQNLDVLSLAISPSTSEVYAGTSDGVMMVSVSQ